MDEGGVTQGDLSIQIVMAMTFIHYEHDVDPLQYEPGFPSTYQARRHVLDYTITYFDFQSSFAVADGWQLGFILPVRLLAADAEFRDVVGATMPGYESIHHRQEVLFGVGDLALQVKWSPFTAGPEGGFMLTLGTGLSLPTGNIEPNPFELGRQGEPHQHMFFGAGIFQPAFDANIGYAGDGWRVQAWGGGKVPIYANKYGYRPPWEMEVTLGAASGFGLSGLDFRVDFGVFHVERAHWAGEPAENSGRTNLLIQGSVSGALTDFLQGFFQVKVPVYTWSSDEQLKVPVVLVAGLATRFNLLD